MKKLLTIILALILTILMQPTYLGSQSQKTVIEDKFQRLNKSVSFAEELVMAFGNQAAKQLLLDAKKSIERSEDFFRRDQLVRAKYFIGQSQLSVTLAMKITFAIAGSSMLDQFDDLIKQAERATESCQKKETERLLSQAKKNQQMAVTAYQNQLARETLEYYRIGTFLAKRAMSLCDVKSNNARDQFLDEKNRFRKLLETAEKRLEENPSHEARLRINQAKNQARFALEAFDSKRYNQSLEFYYKATSLLLRAIELCESHAFRSIENTEVQMRKELSQLNDFISAIQEYYSGTKRKPARRLFRRALRMQKEAQLAFNNGRHGQFLKKCELSRHAVRKALTTLDSIEE